MPLSAVKPEEASELTLFSALELLQSAEAGLSRAVARRLTLLMVSTTKPFGRPPYPAAALLWAVPNTQMAAALIVGLGIIVESIPWSLVGLIWAYCLAWVLVEDLAKLGLHRHLENSRGRHQRFLDRIQSRLHQR